MLLLNKVTGGGGGSSYGTGPIAHSAVSGSGGYTNITTPAITTTGANLFVATVHSYQSNPTVSDSKGNSWLTALQLAAGDCWEAVYYVYAPVVGTGHTFTSVNANYGGFEVSAWSGAAATPKDQANSFQTTASVSSIQAGAITPTSQHQLIIATASIGGTGLTLSSIDSGFTITDTLGTVSGSQGGAQAYLIQGSAASVNPTWTITGGLNEAGAAIVSFKAAS